MYFIDQGTKYFRLQLRKFKHIGTIAEVLRDGLEYAWSSGRHDRLPQLQPVSVF